MSEFTPVFPGGDPSVEALIYLATNDDETTQTETSSPINGIDIPYDQELEN